VTNLRVAKTQQSEAPEGGRIHPSTACADPWPAEGLPIRVVCEQNAGMLWDAYVVCERNVARDLDDLRKFVSGSASRVWPRSAEKHHLAAYKDARAALSAWFRDYLKRHVELELSAHPGSFLVERKRIPAAAIARLEFDFEEGAASGESLPPLIDARLHRVPHADVLAPAALIKASWRDRVSKADLESAMKDIAKSYDGKQPPTFNDVWSKLKALFGPDFPRDAARGALRDYAPQLKRTPGQTKKIKSRS
jgi:hypothetical protein